MGKSGGRSSGRGRGRGGGGLDLSGLDPEVQTGLLVGIIALAVLGCLCWCLAKTRGIR